MANLEADFYDFEALALLKTAPFSLRHAVHPLCCSHTHTLFEGGIERVSHGDRFCFNLQTKGKKNRTF